MTDETAAEKAAHAEIARLCQPGERWRMTVPVNHERDSDMILTATLAQAAARREADAETIRGLREALARLRGDVEALAERWGKPPTALTPSERWENAGTRACGLELRAILARHERPEGEAVERRVHNHQPYRPPCNERRVGDHLRGACLNDDGSDR